MHWSEWDGNPGSRTEVALAIGDALAVLMFFVGVILVALVSAP